MTRRAKYRIGVPVSLGLLVAVIGWCYTLFMVLPGGLDWTAEKDVPFIKEMHPIRLIDPDSVPTDEEGYVFMNWARAEFRARAKVGCLGWVVTTGALAVWAMRAREKREPGS